MFPVHLLANGVFNTKTLCNASLSRVGKWRISMPFIHIIFMVFSYLQVQDSNSQ